MQSLSRALDFLLQTPINPNPIPYIPPTPSPPSENRLHHVQLTTSSSYDNECPTIIYSSIPFIHGDYTIRPISPTFIKYCNEQVLDFKVDLDADSLHNVTTVLSGFEAEHNLPASIDALATYHLPDPIRSDIVNNMIVQQDWMRNPSI